jgi:putative ATPase
VDEIHRFNKAQQDFLLPFVERGDITLIGATTENPSFEVIAPLLSRTRVFVLNLHTEKEMEKIIARTKIKIPKDARDWLVQMANGDARQAITVLETAQKLYGKITVDTLKDAVQSKHLRYDKKGEEHYNTISAFIKSMRASQPDAALYYLARMVDAGEDPLFIARRMVIFASEDIGLAVPTALVVANAVFRACETIGYPECQINLAHGAAYLAECKKSRASYDAYSETLADVKSLGNLPIPMNIRNAPTKLMKDLGYGKGYEKYPVKSQGDHGADDKESYLPEKLKDKKYLK